ncbi:VOC family protein [Rubellicoccus peritrichatus]|uniref:VOC family protein n=1 Tax=Rubellicoccus peritrichatus TaxID=3080537 RepID=A0AAQ3L8H5_9BACT|nr:VOC family protein [Puniceicoccus sp. CR14]WOO41609.1 VOC family protein [Puniceicoccus sp. CR14]
MVTIGIESVLETCLYVDDIDAAETFYGEILGLEFYSKEADKFVFFRVGPAMLLIFIPEASAAGDHELPNHGAKGVQHIAFSVLEEELDEWHSHLEAQEIDIEQDHTWPNGKRSLYFRDPAGNSIELASITIWSK